MFGGKFPGKAGRIILTHYKRFKISEGSLAYTAYIAPLMFTLTRTARLPSQTCP